MWKQIHELTHEIEIVEKHIAEVKEGYVCLSEELLASLNEELNKLYVEKKKIKADYETIYNEYKAQQYEIHMAKLIARRKQELVKLRAQEELEKKSQALKCNELILICRKVLTGHKNEKDKENPQIESSKKKCKGKKKQKQKKADNTETELEKLKERFIELGVVVPKGKSDINNTIKTLTWKLKEIEERELTSSLPIHSNDYEASESTRSSSFFSELIEI